MRLFLTACLFSWILTAQQTSTSTEYTTDLDGNRVPAVQIDVSRSKTESDQTARLPSINGGTVPIEQVEERVIKDDASGRVVERIVRRYDQTGHPGPPEKTVIEERKTPTGTTVQATTYRGDLNGNMTLAERSVTETRNTGSGQDSETTLDRPTINGSLDTVEKKSVVKTGTGESYKENSVIYRKGENGFYPAVKLVTEHSLENGQATANTAEYEVGSSGALELHSQAVTRTSKRPDGSQVTEVDVFGKAVPGTVNSPESGLKLKEREVIERRPGSGGSTVETVSVQRPTVSDPGVLGPPKIISETVCTGKCR